MPGTHIVIILLTALFFSLIACIILSISIATNKWEFISYDSSTALDSFQNSSGHGRWYITSDFKEDHFMRVVNLTIPKGGNISHLISTTTYMLDVYGGVWVMCDYVSGKKNV